MPKSDVKQKITTTTHQLTIASLSYYNVTWGTGMIASSSTFRPHPGKVIRDLFRQLHAVWHGTEALVYSNHPRKAAASSYRAIILGGLPVAYPGSSAQLRC